MLHHIAFKEAGWPQMIFFLLIPTTSIQLLPAAPDFPILLSVKYEKKVQLFSKHFLNFPQRESEDKRTSLRILVPKSKSA